MNVVALAASKNEACKEMSNLVDSMLNSLVAHFKKSSKRKSTLQTLQNKLNDAQRILKRYYKIRWLSRWQVVTTLYDSLELVLIYLRDYSSNDDANIPNLFGKSWDFKFIYNLYFLVDILHMLSKLSKIFQSKLVDISTIGSIVKTEIVNIGCVSFLTLVI